jgi:hypothetical protein
MEACEVQGWGGKEGELAPEDVEFIAGLLKKTDPDDTNHTDVDSAPAS